MSRRDQNEVQNKESVAYKKVKTNMNADDDDGDFISSNKNTSLRSHWKYTSSPSLQSLESASSSIVDTKMMDKVNNPEYNKSHTPPYQIYSISENQNLIIRLRNEKQAILAMTYGMNFYFHSFYLVKLIPLVNIMRHIGYISLLTNSPWNPLLDKNSEGWLNCHIFAPLINDCFLTYEEIYVHQCEEMSLASIMRKNLTREESEKKFSGHKIE
ncbi:hypothetical protein C1645_745654 [Glomus cerebriforme]|uniref:Uncharacterized protein n=1 Tax=Glomus cerebriforme TaxID=658196 RepID=A0A397S786_9GLOM|nr:hypothetical protein C1645_745654 [Glomus cerebriforme]